MPIEQEEDGKEAVDDVEEQPAVEITDHGDGDDPEEGDTETEASDEAKEEAGDDETVVSLGEEPEPTAEQESSVFRDLRKRLRDQEREAKAAKAELERLKAPAKPKLGPKPIPEDFDFDNDKYAEAMETWTEQKLAAKAEADEGRKAQEKRDEEWRGDVSRFQERRAELSTKVVGYADAEEVAGSALSLEQQTAIIKYAEQPEALFYALGRNEKKLAELAGEKDILKFVATVAKLEAKDLTVTTSKKSPPKPARTTGGTNAPATAVGNTTERLLKESEKSGNINGLVEELRRKKEK